MDDLNIRDNDYWTALEILAEETGTSGNVWLRSSPGIRLMGQFDWAMRTYRNWHPEDAETYLLAFPGLNRVRFQISLSGTLSPRRRRGPRSSGSLIISYLLVPEYKREIPLFTFPKIVYNPTYSKARSVR